MVRALWAFLASLIAGLSVVQVAATTGRADETMIVAYLLVPVVAVVALIVLLIAGLGDSGAARVRRLGPLALACMALLGLLAVGWEVAKAGPATLVRYASLYLALFLGPMAAVATQWLILRRDDRTGARGSDG